MAREILPVLIGFAAGVILGSILWTVPPSTKDNAKEYDRLLENAKAEWELELRLEEIEGRLEKAESYKHFHLEHGRLPQ